MLRLTILAEQLYTPAQTVAKVLAHQINRRAERQNQESLREGRVRNSAGEVTA